MNCNYLGKSALGLLRMNGVGWIEISYCLWTCDTWQIIAKPSIHLLNPTTLVYLSAQYLCNYGAKLSEKLMQDTAYFGECFGETKSQEITLEENSGSGGRGALETPATNRKK